MTCRIGIPRALLYYHYHRLWECFFRELGAEVLYSDETNKSTVDRGLARISDEACLPVKVFFGHVAQLAEKNPDFLFVPRMVSVEKKAYICPKIMGLPDMLEAVKLPTPPLLKPTMNMVASDNIDDFLWEAARPLTRDRKSIKRAWQLAWVEQKKQEEEMSRRYLAVSEGSGAIKTGNSRHAGGKGYLDILLIGHHYNIYDKHLNLDLLGKLKNLGCRVWTQDHIPQSQRRKALEGLPKSLFWTYGRSLLGAALSFAQRGALFSKRKGVVIVTSFGCGIDAFIGNMIIRHLQSRQLPFLYLTLDEHTGEAGIATRLEAFIDMLLYKEGLDEHHLPPYGKHLGNPERLA